MKPTITLSAAKPETVKVSFNSVQAAVVGAKRVYLPYRVIADCPSCNLSCDVDLERHSLDFPLIGAPIEVPLYCDDCDLDFVAKIVVHLSLTAWSSG